MQGLHLTADLGGCASDSAPMTDPSALRALCLEAVSGSGLQAVNDLFHRFDPGPGITGVVLLAESHVAVHTWPEMGAVTLDVYVCNFGGDNTAAARLLMATLVRAFEPELVKEHAIERGLTPSPTGGRGPHPSPLPRAGEEAGAVARAAAPPWNIASSKTE